MWIFKSWNNNFFFRWKNLQMFLLWKGFQTIVTTSTTYKITYWYVYFIFLYNFLIIQKFLHIKTIIHQHYNNLTCFFNKTVGDWKPNMNNEFLCLLSFKSCSLKKEKQTVLKFFSNCNSLKKSNHIWLMVTNWCYYKSQTFILASFCNFPWARVDLNLKCISKS